MRIIVQRDDGTEVDVTTAVQITYDALHASMDFGSGFLDTEELGAMVVLAESAGFDGFNEIASDAWMERKRQQWQERYAHLNGHRYRDRPALPRREDMTDEERDAVLAELRAAVKES